VADNYECMNCGVTRSEGDGMVSCRDNLGASCRKPTSIYHKWVDRIDSGVFTESQCRQWAQAVYTLGVGYEPRGKRSNLTHEEAEALLHYMADKGGVALTREHVDKGFRWLKLYGAKKGLPPAMVRHVVGFHFYGVARVDNNAYGWAVSAACVYRALCDDGREWDYCAAAWQAQAYSGADGLWWREVDPARK
jgi:hypothetical protein